MSADARLLVDLDLGPAHRSRLTAASELLYFNYFCMLLGKLCARKDKCTSTAHCSLSVRKAKINLQNNTHNITSITHPNLSFYLRETYRICNFLANYCDYTRKQYKTPISLSPEVYETSSKTGSRIRILYLLTGHIQTCHIS